MIDPWPHLVAEANAIGYQVELVEYCESADSPGLLGAGMGVIIYRLKIIRIRENLTQEERVETLIHELDHAYDPDNGEEIDRLRWNEKHRSLHHTKTPLGEAG